MKLPRRLEFVSPSLSLPHAAVAVAVLERDPSRTPRVAWNVGGAPFYSTDCVACFDELSYGVARTSVYTRENAAGASLRLSSPEHLAPVFLLWPSRRFDVSVDSEVPMMDGSALPFFTALRRAAGTPEDIQFYDAPVKAEWKLPRGFVRITPSEAFEVEYILERPEMDGFVSAADVSVYSAENLYSLLSARTFIFGSEYASAREAGLLAGVDASCGLLLEDRLPHYRVAEEPARHKILDLLGDLSFAVPALPRVRIEIMNGGHTSHRQILEKVLPYAKTFVPEKV